MKMEDVDEESYAEDDEVKFEEESDANAKALELSGSDSMNRVYKVIEI